MGDYNNGDVKGMASDSEGNIYLIGHTDGSADFNSDGDAYDDDESGSGPYSYFDIYISKWTSTGKFVWAHRFGGQAYDYGKAIGVDSDNNVYVTGIVNGAADLNGDGDASDTYEASGGALFLSKWTNAGTFLWAKRISGGTAGYAIGTDSSNNVYLTGVLSGLADLNGDGDTSDPAEATSTIYAFSDAFLGKWTSDGTFVWAKRIGGLDNDYGYAVGVDSDNNVYLGGAINNVADLNGDGDTGDAKEATSTVHSTNDAFISKWSNDGSFLWAQRISGVCNGLGLDPQNNLYLTGNIFNVADLNGDDDASDPEEATSSPYGSNDIFLSKWSSDGNFSWAERLGGTTYDTGSAISVDKDSFYVVGNVELSADLNGDGDKTDAEEATGGVHGGYDIFVSKWSNAGTFEWTKRLGGASTDYGYAVSRSNGRVILAGTVQNAADLNGDGDTSDSEETTSGFYIGEDPVMISFSTGDPIGGNGDIAVSGNSGTISLATSSVYSIASGASTSLLLELSAANLAPNDKMTVGFGNVAASGADSGFSITPANSVFPAQHYISSSSVSFTSQSDQVFTYGQATTSISSIRVSDDGGTSVKAATDIYIAIATSTFDYRWDTTDTLASLSGPAAAKASTTVSYPSDSVLKIDVTNDFSAGDYLVISGLSYRDFNAATSSQSGALMLYLSGSYNGAASSSDPKNVAIAGTISIADHALGQASNQWVHATSSVTGGHFRYSFVSQGENMNIGNTLFNLTSVSGVVSSDISNAFLYEDVSKNGIYDNLPVLALAIRKNLNLQAFAIDSVRNVYSLSYANGSVDLNGDGDTSDAQETGGGIYNSDDIFLCKFSPTGAFLWARRIGGSGPDYGNSLAIDPYDNVYLTGRVYNAADLNSDGDTGDSEEATGGVYNSSDIFISKLTSSGNLLWAQRIGGTGSDYGMAVRTDRSGNAYVTGRVNGTADLNSDGDTGEAKEATGGVYAGDDVYFGKWAADGTFLWARRIGGAGSDNGNVIGTDFSGNVYLTGRVSNAADLNSDGDTGDSEEATGGVYAGTDAFQSKWAADGTFLWAQRIGGAGFDSSTGISIDLSGKVYLTGSVNGAADLNSDGDIGDSEEASGGVYANDDAFLSKWDSDGAFLWSQRIGGSNYDNGSYLDTDIEGNAYLIGIVYGAADLNSDSDTNDIGEAGGGVYAITNDVFVSKWTSSGAFTWGLRLGSTSGDGAYGIVLDASNSVYIAMDTSGNSIADVNGDAKITETFEATGYNFIGKFYDNDKLISTGQTSISGSAGTISFATSTSYQPSLMSTNYALELTANNLSGHDGMSISLASLDATGTVSGLAISPALSSSDASHTVDPLAMSSAGDQYYQIGQATTSISAIRITANSDGIIKAGDSIYLSLATSTFHFFFDTSDTLASLSGTAASKIGSEVTYVSDSLMKLTANSDFISGEYVDIAGLSYSSFSNTNILQSGALSLYLGSLHAGSPDATDPRSVSVYGSLAASDHILGQTANKWSLGQNATTTTHYRYELLPQGENTLISTTTFNLTGLSGVSISDLSSAKLYYDYAQDGKADAIPAFSYAKRTGGLGNASQNAVTMDAQGNVYVTGYVNGNADLNGDGDMVDAGETAVFTSEVFVSKWSSAGVLLWTRRFAGSDVSASKAIALDAAGNIYITGYVSLAADFNGDGDRIDAGEAGGGVYAYYDAFLLKLSPSGAFSWAKRIGGSNFDYGYALGVDASSSVYLAGSVSDADLNSDGDKGEAGEAQSGIYSSDDAFLSKWSSDGTFVWAKRLGGGGFSESGNSIGIDSGNNIYLAGSINGNADLNGDGDTSDSEEASGGVYSSIDVFLSKWTSDGVFVWAQRVGGTSWDFGYAVSVDANNNIYLTGYVNGAADLNSDGDTGDSEESTGGVYGSDDVFLSKWTTDGSFLWTQRIGGTGSDKGYALSVDTASNVYLGGFVNAVADLNSDGDTGDDQESSGGIYAGDDVFVSKWTSTGNSLWTRRLGGSSSEYAYALKAGLAGEIYVAGNIYGAADLNGDGDTSDPGEASGYSMFCTRFSNDSQIAYNGDISLSGTTGTITFATSTPYPVFAGTSTGFLLSLTASNLAPGDTMMIDFSGASTTGAITGMSLVPEGNPLAAIHSYSLNITVANHTLGQIANQWSGQNSFDGVLFRYRISSANGETIDLGTTTISLSSISGVTANDIRSAKLSFDTNSDGLADGGLPSYNGQVSINGANGTITFAVPEPYSISTSTDFLVSLSAAELRQTGSFVGIKGNLSVKGKMGIKSGSNTPTVYDTMTLGFSSLESANETFNYTDNATEAVHIRN